MRWMSVLQKWMRRKEIFISAQIHSYISFNSLTQILLHISSHFLPFFLSSSSFLLPCSKSYVLKVSFLHTRVNTRRASKVAISRPLDISIYPLWQTLAERRCLRVPALRRCWQMIRGRRHRIETRSKGLEGEKGEFLEGFVRAAVSQGALWLKHVLEGWMRAAGCRSQLPFQKKDKVVCQAVIMLNTSTWYKERN